MYQSIGKLLALGVIVGIGTLAILHAQRGLNETND
jgi:hypothetical protein